MPWLIIGLLPSAWVVWTIATRHRIGPLVAASRLVVFGASIFAIEHATFATTCAVDVGCPVPGTFFSHDHVRLHMFMAGVYTAVAAGALIVVARTLLLNGRRIGWYTVLAALAVGGTLEVMLANIWFAHALAEDVTVGRRTFEDLSFMFLFSYLLAWTAALVISYQTVFSKDTVSPGGLTQET